jgi:cytochrome c biogenesis protein CcmG/thiol:disulfide interchange protein DsbE
MSSRPPRPRTSSSSVAKAAKAGDGSKRIWLIAAVVAVVAFAGIIAVALSQESDGDDGGGETAAVTVTGDGLSGFQADPEGAIGQAAPELSGTSVDGEAITIENDGRPKVISFLAHWCPHCQAEVPLVVDWVEANGLPDDVDIVAVSTSVTPGRDNYPPSAWFEDEGWTIPTMKDDAVSTAHAAFGAGGFPYFVVVDADGNVVNRTSGRLAEGQFEALLEQARTGTVG